MTGKGELFCAIDNSCKSNIKPGDDKALHVEGKGAMEVHTTEGKNKVNDVYFTPNLKHNLLSVGQIMEKNYKLIFEDNKCIIYDKNHEHRLVTTIPMTKNRLFPLKFGEQNTKFDNIAIDDKSWLWHLRNGHLNFASLRLLVS